MDSAALRLRSHGTDGPWVVVLHGGPAAAGSAGALARGLAGHFRVLEPWQRGAGEEPLTVARHVSDLSEVIAAHCGGIRPAVVGHSWGAMLALAHASTHPDAISAVVIIGCGTFDRDARARMKVVVRDRTDSELGAGLERLAREILDPGALVVARQRLMRRTETYADIGIDEVDDRSGPFDVRAHEETWRDMIRLQESGVYPQAFRAITSPVLMLHGAYDPHPGHMIRDSLLPHVPHLEYREWERCGHEPWRERFVRDEFFDVLHQWLGRP